MKMKNLIKRGKFKFWKKGIKFNFCEKIQKNEIVNFLFENNVKKHKIPCFEVFSSQIEILNAPIDYYLAIIKMIRMAKTRICISNLYLGTGKMEEYIVEELIKAIERNPNLKVTIVIDRARGNNDGVLIV